MQKNVKSVAYQPLSDTKLYIKCILKNHNYYFLDNMSREEFKNENIVLTSNTLYYFTLHLKLSTLFYSTQLTDIFAYEVPKLTKLRSSLEDSTYSAYSASRTPAGVELLTGGGKSSSSVLLYNFHILNTQARFYVFVSSYSFSTSYQRLPSSF